MTAFKNQQGGVFVHLSLFIYTLYFIPLCPEPSPHTRSGSSSAPAPWDVCSRGTLYRAEAMEPRIERRMGREEGWARRRLPREQRRCWESSGGPAGNKISESHRRRAGLRTDVDVWSNPDGTVLRARALYGGFLWRLRPGRAFTRSGVSPQIVPWMLNNLLWFLRKNYVSVFRVLKFGTVGWG